MREALALSDEAASAGPATMAPASPLVAIEAVAGILGQAAIHRDAIITFAGWTGKPLVQILSLTDGY